MGIGNSAALNKQLEKIEKQHALVVNDLTVQIKNNEQEIVNAKQKLGEKETEIQVQTHQMQELRAEFDEQAHQMKQQLSELQEQQTQLEQQLSEQTARFDESLTQIQILNAELEQKNAQVLELSLNIDQHIISQEQIATSDVEIISALQKSNLELLDNARNAEETSKQTGLKLQKLEMENLRLRKIQDQLCLQRQDEEVKAHQQLDQTAHKKLDFEAQISQLKVDNEENMKKLKTSELQKAQLQKENAKLAFQLENSKCGEATMQQQLSNSQDKIQRLSEQILSLVQSQSQIQVLKTELEQKKAEIRRFSEQVQQKDQIVATEAGKFEQLQLDLQKLKKRVLNSDEEAISANQKVELSKMENLKLQKELELLRQVQRETELQLKNTNSDKVQLQTEVQKLKAELDLQVANNKVLSEKLISKATSKNDFEINCIEKPKKNVQIEGNELPQEQEEKSTTNPTEQNRKNEEPLLSNGYKTIIEDTKSTKKEDGQEIVVLTFDQIKDFKLTPNALNQFQIATKAINSNVGETNRIIDEIRHICAIQNYLIPNQVIYSMTIQYFTFKFTLGAKIIYNNCLKLDLDRKSYYDSQNPNNQVTQLLIRAANALCDEIPVSPKERLTMKQLDTIREIIEQKYPELWFLEITTTSDLQGIINRIQIFKEDKTLITNLNNQLLEIKKQFENEFEDLIRSCSIYHNDLQLRYKIEEVIVKRLQQTEYDLNVYSHKYDVVGCLINKKCVCKGFAAGFSFLAQISGLEVVQVCGQSLKTVNYQDSAMHRWNMIKLDGWYHVDSTWLGPNVASQIYLNFSDKLRYSEVRLQQQLSPPTANNMKCNYFQQKNLLLCDKQSVTKFVTNVGLTNLVGDFYCTFPVDMAEEIKNLRYTQEKDFTYQLSYSQSATLYFYHLELTCNASLLKGYPEIAIIGQKYFVEDDGEFDTRIQDLMRVSKATSVSHSKNGDTIEFTCKKRDE